MAAAMITACQNDDTDFSAYTSGAATTARVIYIAYNGSTVTVSGDDNNYVTTSGADVTVNTGTDTDSLLLVLSGSTTDGSLLVYREKKYGIRMNGVSIHNSDGPAINNQCGKSLYIELASGTTNTLTDGTAYDETVSYQQKGTLFSEGQIYFSGSGTLTVTANCKNAIACDDYIYILQDVVINTTTQSTGSNGIKVNDGLYVQGGTVSIDVQSAAGRGIKCDSVVVVSGGTTTIATSGDCVYDSDEQDYSSAACIKCADDFTMTGGTLTMTSSGDGGKGVNCDGAVAVSGGTFSAITTGSNNYAKPKAVKGDGITVSGGSFYAAVTKSWACDNGVDSDTPADRITVSGNPTTTTIEKKLVNIVY